MTWLVLLLAVAAYGSYIWGAQYFFQTADVGAARGKRWISVAVGLVIMLNLGHLVLAPTGSDVLCCLALVCFAASIVLFWCGVRAARVMRLAFLGSTAAPVKIIQNGPYRLIRHPFYASYILGWLGAAIGAPTPFTWATCLSLTFFYIWAAKREENHLLLSAYGTHYAAYQSVTGMFVPKLRARQI